MATRGRTIGCTTLLIVAVVAAVIGPLGGSGFGGTGAAVLDFSQCASGTGVDSGCPEGWINGILHASNSHYREGQVVPQRLILRLPGGSPAAGRTIALQYQTRKGDVHAYDSLATWNLTQDAAGRCDGLADADCPGGDASRFPIPDDPTEVPPAALTGAMTASHMIPAGAGRQMTMFGGTITDVSVPSHANAAGSGADDATVVVTYEVADTAAPRTVELLFGAHLAAALGAQGWGNALGASSISGGPYHARVVAVDGEAVGARDNQIMGATVGHPSIATTPVPSAGIVGTVVHDTASVSGGIAPSGTVTFALYPPDDPGCSAAPVFTSAVPLVAGSASSAEYVTTTAGIYRWIATYSGDAANASAAGGCDEEPVFITKAVPTMGTVPDPVLAVVGELIRDTATLDGGFSPAGEITFLLYSPADPTCQGEPVFTSTGSIADGRAVSGSYVVTEPGTYHWVATYAGDDVNEAAAGACADEPVSVAAADTSTGSDGGGDTTDGGGDDGASTDTGSGNAETDGADSQAEAGSADADANDGSGTSAQASDDADALAESKVLGRMMVAGDTAGTLPRTGSDALGLAVSGLGLVGIGAIMLASVRRRRHAGQH